MKFRDIVKRIYKEWEHDADFNIISKHNDETIINKMKKILFCWFPKETKLKYNYFYFTNYNTGNIIAYFFILYKNELHVYEKENEIIKLVTLYLITNNGYKCISYREGFIISNKKYINGKLVEIDTKVINNNDYNLHSCIIRKLNRYSLIKDNNIIESQFNFSRLNYTYNYNMIYINKIGYYDEDNIYMICNFRFIVLFI